jgi:hypothetical protein
LEILNRDHNILIIKLKQTFMASKSKSTAPLVHFDRPDDALENQSPAKPAPARPQLDRADPAGESRRQGAFDAEFVWREVPLQGFSVSREALFGQLRLAMGAPPLRFCLADPDAFAADAQRILFLCSHPPEVFNRLRADMAMLQSGVDEWADANISVAEKLTAETMAMQIWLAAQENRHEPAPAATPHGDDSGN